MKVFSPPSYPSLKDTKSVFLAGSIEMGAAPDWQKEFIDMFGRSFGPAHSSDSWTILNPRRPDWDASWKQEISDPQFYQQVEWELSYLEKANHIVFYFAEDTISPISLLELGKFSSRGNALVITHQRFQRKGNVDIFCHRYNIPKFYNMEGIVKHLKNAH